MLVPTVLLARRCGGSCAVGDTEFSEGDDLGVVRVTKWKRTHVINNGINNLKKRTCLKVTLYVFKKLTFSGNRKQSHQCIANVNLSTLMEIIKHLYNMGNRV